MVAKKDDKTESAIMFVVGLLIVVLVLTVIINNKEIAKITGNVLGTRLSGQINVTIGQNLTINLVSYNLSFGQGYVTAGAPHATLNSSTPSQTIAVLNGANWTNTSEFNGATFSPSRIYLRNDGNVNASVSMITSKNAQEFLGGTSPVFEYNTSEKEGGACITADTREWSTVSNSSTQQLCGNLCAVDTKDEIYIDFRLTIPYDTQGTREVFFNVTGTAIT